MTTDEKLHLHATLLANGTLLAKREIEWRAKELAQAYLEGRLQSESGNEETVAYRKALDEIIATSDDPEAVRIAHQAITPYTEWKAVSPEVAAKIDAAVRGGVVSSDKPDSECHALMHSLDSNDLRSWRTIAFRLERDLAELKHDMERGAANHSADLSTPSAETFTDADMERMWQAAGGEFHGPNVETGTMPKVNLMRFLHELVSVAQRPRLQSASAQSDAKDAARYRWLRENDHDGRRLEIVECYHGEMMDRRIDKAMSAADSSTKK